MICEKHRDSLSLYLQIQKTSHPYIRNFRQRYDNKWNNTSSSYRKKSVDGSHTPAICGGEQTAK